MTGQALSCTMICRLIEPYVDGELSPLMHQAVASHLAECPHCAAEAGQLASLEALISSWPVIGPAELIELDAAGQRLLAGPFVVTTRQQGLEAPRASGGAWLITVGGKALGGLRSGGRWAWRTVRPARPPVQQLAPGAVVSRPAGVGAVRIILELTSVLARRLAASPSTQPIGSAGRVHPQAGKQPAGRRRGIAATASNQAKVMARGSWRRVQAKLTDWGRLGWEAVTLG